MISTELFYHLRFKARRVIMDLHKYAKSAEKILTQMAGYILLVNTKHEIVWANQKTIQSFGFESLDEIVGETYVNLKYGMSGRSESIKACDKSVFASNKQISCIGYNEYADGWKLAFCEKSLITNDEKKPISLISHWNDLTNYNLVDIGRFMFDSEKNNIKSSKEFTYKIEEETSNRYSLSTRQIECLFFLLRGKTDKDIAKIFNLSPRTVESYIQEIKFKMQCSTRGQIIDKSFNEGLFNTYPKSFLDKNIMNAA
jgi:DNA-binding CsgD family transcriptional regulator